MTLVEGRYLDKVWLCDHILVTLVTFSLLIFMLFGHLFSFPFYSHSLSCHLQVRSNFVGSDMISFDLYDRLQISYNQSYRTFSTPVLRDVGMVG